MSKEKLSRRDRRFRERIHEEVSEVSQYLGDMFLNFFTKATDPEGEEVVKRMEQIDTQWRLFCQKKHLVPDAFSHMKKYMDSVVGDYYKLKSQVHEVENIDK